MKQVRSILTGFREAFYIEPCPTVTPDHVQISALSRALRINVKVAYLDGRGEDEKVDFVELQNVEEGYNGMRDVVLLYRCVLFANIVHLVVWR